MTEDEAKTKWCPFIKGENGDAEARAVCIASACMAWRWKYGGPSTPVNPGDPGGCGLAGPVQ